jgi:hypothetical protein
LFPLLCATLSGTGKIELVRCKVPRNQWLGFQLGQERSLQGPKWSIPPDVGQEQLFITHSLQKSLVGLAFALMVAGVAPV